MITLLNFYNPHVAIGDSSPTASNKLPRISLLKTDFYPGSSCCCSSAKKDKGRTGDER